MMMKIPMAIQTTKYNAIFPVHIFLLLLLMFSIRHSPHFFCWWIFVWLWMFAVYTWDVRIFFCTCICCLNCAFFIFIYFVFYSFLFICFFWGEYCLRSIVNVFLFVLWFWAVFLPLSRFEPHMFANIMCCERKGWRYTHINSHTTSHNVNFDFFCSFFLFFLANNAFSKRRAKALCETNTIFPLCIYASSNNIHVVILYA